MRTPSCYESQVSLGHEDGSDDVGVGGRGANDICLLSAC